MTNEQYYWYVQRRSLLKAYAAQASNLHVAAAAGSSDDTAPAPTPETDTKDDTDKTVFAADLANPEIAKTELTEDIGLSAESLEITVEDDK